VGESRTILELRWLHRKSISQSGKAYKWLLWPDFLLIVQKARKNFEVHFQAYETCRKKISTGNDKQRQLFARAQRQMAMAYQEYLILKLLSEIPHRRRTICELEINRSLLKDKSSQQWFIRHDDTMVLTFPIELTNVIDDFIKVGRPVLLKQNKSLYASKHLFLGARSGFPLTSRALSRIILKTCSQYSGKRTNTHLPRETTFIHACKSSVTLEQQLETRESAAASSKSDSRPKLRKNAPRPFASNYDDLKRCKVVVSRRPIPMPPGKSVWILPKNFRLGHYTV
jgi:hypothetical protein